MSISGLGCQSPFGQNFKLLCLYKLTRKVPNTTIAEFANTVDPDDNEPAHLDLQVLPSSFQFVNIIQFILKVFEILQT